MRKLLFGSSIAMVVVVACVESNTVAPGSVDGPQGQLGGACLANGKCNAGLECGLVDGGVAQCVAEGGATTTASSSSGASGSTSSSGSIPTDGATPVDSGTEAGPGECTITPEKFPCGGDNPPTACFGATVSCTITGCSDNNAVRWDCNVPQNCGTGIACCVSATAATAKPGASCAVGTLELVAGQMQGATCGASTSCAGGSAQLCATSADCPATQKCTPVKVTGGGAAINGSVLGVCTP